MLLGTDRSCYTAILDAQFALGGRYHRNQSLYERMLQLQPQESRQKIRLFPDPDIDNWIEAEIACGQDGKLVSQLFDASAQESLGMEVYLDGVVLTPTEQAFCCLYAVIKHEEAVWYLDYLHRTHIG